MKKIIFTYALISSMGFPLAAVRYEVKKGVDLEQTVKENFKIIPPSQWKQGDKFYYTQKELNILLKRLNPVLKDTIDYTDKIFEFSGVKSNVDWFGTETVNMLFRLEDTEYIYETGKSLQQFTEADYNPLIPGLISEQELIFAADFFTGSEFYIMDNEWYNLDDTPVFNSRKFIKVNIAGFKPGNDDMPIKILFSPVDDEKIYYVRGVLSGTLNATRRNQFFKLFSDNNPQDKYKNITSSNWNSIINSKPAIGMTQDEVKLCIGNPSEIKRIPTYSGLRLVWYYNAGTMIYFEDGLVKDIKK